MIKRNYSQANVKSEKKVTNFALPWQPWSTEQKYGMIANDNSNKIFIKYTRKYIMCYENKKIDWSLKLIVSAKSLHQTSEQMLLLPIYVRLPGKKLLTVI